MKLHNKKELEPYRKALRNEGTSAEARLWTMLKGKQLDGRKFRRQHSIKNYIVDFYCPAEKLIVELDGARHFTPEGQLSDEARDEDLQKLGFQVLRIENKEVFEYPELVLEQIRNCFGKT